MNIPNQYSIINLLHLTARCNRGLNHGVGVMAWMHPPVHRILGWATRPSHLSLIRCVWRLDQLNAITNQEVFVKGLPAESDQSTINRFPTLLEATLLGVNGDKIGNIADFVFDTTTGNILYYLVSRSNPNIPGTSRWRFDIDRIVDQEAGLVSSNIYSIDELPLIKSSIRQTVISKSKKIKEDLLEFSSIANEKLEGWLEEDETDSYTDKFYSNNQSYDEIPDMKSNIEDPYSIQHNRSDFYIENEEDPWI